MFVDATLLHVKECGLIELYGRGAVCRFDVISVYLQLRLCAHDGCLRKEQVAVGLMSFGLLGILRDLKITDKTSAGVVGENEFDELVRCSASHSVRNVGLSGYLFIAVQVLQPVNLRLTAFS